ncbi:hypothetical protein MegaChil _gp0733 [Megavirus chiliensis]|nr:hypothetical protein MegaChil _gp0733 [Megavirus chiliensis]AUV58680.1 hypothetical protein [Bandra megavirus]
MNKLLYNQNYIIMSTQEYTIPTDKNEKDSTKIQENFDNSVVSKGLGLTYLVIHMAAFIFALYLAFKCSKGLNIGAIIVAFFCPWIYIIYVLVTKGGICSGYVNGVPPTEI